MKYVISMDYSSLSNEEKFRECETKTSLTLPILKLSISRQLIFAMTTI